MAKNLRKFSSTAEYENYKATDGWDYPSVCFVETSFENQIYYNNEFIMRLHPFRHFQEASHWPILKSG